MTEASQAEQLFELVVAALQSHQRLERIEAEFEARLKDYWARVQKNIDHGVELARIEWEKEVVRDERTKEHLDRENDSLDRKNRRLLARLAKAQSELATLRKTKHGRRPKGRR
jgi:hypothetical protein